MKIAQSAPKMCVVSNVGDDYSNWLPKKYPFIPDVSPSVDQGELKLVRAELAALKKDVEQMKRDLIAAKKQDEEEGNADCEMEDKVALLKKVAEMVGVDLSQVWPEDK